MSVKWWEFSGEEQIRFMEDGGEITCPITIGVDDPDDSILVLKRDLPDLQRWQPHHTEQGFFVDEFSANRTYGQLEYAGLMTYIWSGQVRWTNTILQNPLDQPAKLVNVRNESLDAATYWDRNKKAILNTAGSLVEPIPKRELIKVFVFQKNVPGLVEELLDLEDVINSDSVSILGQQRQPKTLLLRKVEFGDEDKADEVSFRVLTLELAYRKSTWVHQFPSRGFEELITLPARVSTGQLPINGPKVRFRRLITLDDGTRPTEAQLLDADGRWIKEPAPEDVVILTAEVLEEVAFNPLLQYIAQ